MPRIACVIIIPHGYRVIFSGFWGNHQPNLGHSQISCLPGLPSLSLSFWLNKGIIHYILSLKAQSSTKKLIIFNIEQFEKFEKNDISTCFKR